MSQNSHESERDLFFPEKGCVPTTRECVLLEAAMQPSVGGGESCLSCNRSRAVLGGQGSEERWGDCRGMATCPQLHLPGPPISEWIQTVFHSGMLTFPDSKLSTELTQEPVCCWHRSSDVRRVLNVLGSGAMRFQSLLGFLN